MAGYIGSKASVVSSGAERKKTFTITGATTSLTGLNYTVGKVHVFQNGVRLVDGTDYTATNGTTITLTAAAQSGDNVVVISQAGFQVADALLTSGGTMTGDLTVQGAFTSQGIDDNSNATAITIDSSENILFGGITDKNVFNDTSGTGASINNNAGEMQIKNASDTCLYLNRTGSDGIIVSLRKDGTAVGNIGTTGGDLYIATGDTGVRFDDSTDQIRACTNAGSNRDGAIDIGFTDSRFKDLYLSGGVYLGGTVAANKLDDVETGTFTIGFQGATVSASNTTALYTKIGDLVTWYWYSQPTTISSASGVAHLTGLPFTVSNANSNYNPALIAHNTFFGGSATAGQHAYHLVGNNKLQFNNVGATSNPAFVNGSSKYLMIQGTYKTNS